MKHFIVVAGNIGVGKSTLTAMLADRLEGKAYLEEPQDYPYLEDFYSDMRAWSFHNQLSFIVKKAEEQCHIAKQGGIAVQDRSLYEAHQVFSKVLHKLGILSTRDFLMLERIFSWLSSHLVLPDLLVYLKADVSFLVTRIEKRARSAEASVWPGLLTELNEQYELWFTGLSGLPCVALEMSNVDVLRNDEHFKGVLRVVKTHLNLL